MYGLRKGEKVFQAVLFDFDGLILDTECPEFISWQEIFDRHGLALPLETWVAHTGKGAGVGSFSPSEALETLLGRPIDRDAIRVGRRKRFAELMRDEALLPGVEDRLQEARHLGWKVGLVSSSPREWVTSYLTPFGLTDAFDALFCGDEVSRTKPDPELYLKALSYFSLHANQAVVLEDSINGIAAAKAAGLYCVAVPNALTRHSRLDQADLIVNSLADITLQELQYRFSQQP
jgi:HAD superfamily hydrolase (TIGR01509 family)